jgi:hypothetical protein
VASQAGTGGTPKPAANKTQRKNEASAAKPGTRGRAASDGYSAKDITVLEGLEAVRLRPGM